MCGTRERRWSNFDSSTFGGPGGGWPLAAAGPPGKSQPDTLEHSDREAAPPGRTSDLEPFSSQFSKGAPQGAPPSRFGGGMEPSPPHGRALLTDLPLEP